MQRAFTPFLRQSKNVTSIRTSSSYVDTSTQEPVPKTDGRMQFWRPPIYVGPYVNPLQRGPDYKIVGGIRPLATTKYEVERLQEQFELGKQIVQCLKEIKEVETLYEEDKKHRETHENERTKWTPAVKTAQEIY
uniref:Large ribosomal subunit protein mL52 n=1 Tax=Panagrolaimus sp. PS1159 TaxID=55785 RepID=A0AC35FYJ8_9BILA